MTDFQPIHEAITDNDWPFVRDECLNQDRSEEADSGVVNAFCCELQSICDIGRGDGTRHAEIVLVMMESTINPTWGHIADFITWAIVQEQIDEGHA